MKKCVKQECGGYNTNERGNCGFSYLGPTDTCPNLIEQPHPEHAEGSREEDLAKRFHEKYERLAPYHGYKTREKSAVPWVEVPKENKALMIHVCTELLGEGMKEIRTALALMNSMILSGASHSDQSESIYHKAMEALDSHPEHAEGPSLGELHV